MPTAKAGARSRALVPRLGLMLSMVAGEVDGGRRGWWGQTRLVGAGEVNGAVSHRPHARARQHWTLRKPPGQIPSQHNCSCIRTSKRHPIVGITMMYRLYIIFHWLRERTSQFTEVGYGLREWTVRSRKKGLRELTRYSAEEPPPWMD